MGIDIYAEWRGMALEESKAQITGSESISPQPAPLPQHATDTIDYVATDTNGLTATSTVLIEASPSIVPIDDASTTTVTAATCTTTTVSTSTAQ